MPETTRRQFLKQSATVGTTLGTGLLLAPWLQAKAEPTEAQSTCSYKATGSSTKPAVCSKTGCLSPIDFTQRLSQVEGISQGQLQAHLSLYKGYIKKANSIHAKLNSLSPEDWAKTNPTYHPFRELHVEQSYAENGAVLHEGYFGNLGGRKAEASQTLKNEIARSFGSWKRYVSNLEAVAKSMRGWAVTGYSLRDGKLHTYGLDTHNVYAPVGVVPILVLDVYEHAYMIDFGTKRAAYIEAFLANIDWSVVEERLNTAASA